MKIAVRVGNEDGWWVDTIYRPARGDGDYVVRGGTFAVGFDRDGKVWVADLDDLLVIEVPK